MSKTIIQIKVKNEKGAKYLDTLIWHSELTLGSRLMIDQITQKLGVSYIPGCESFFWTESNCKIRTEHRYEYSQ